MIIASAIKLNDGRIFVGSRHGDCYAKMKELGVPKEDCNNGAIQGFINDYLYFLDRTEAYYIAFKNGQCGKHEYNENCHPDLKVKKEDWKPILISEDLW